MIQKHHPFRNFSSFSLDNHQLFFPFHENCKIEHESNWHAFMYVGLLNYNHHCNSNLNTTLIHWFRFIAAIIIFSAKCINLTLIIFIPYIFNLIRGKVDEAQFTMKACQQFFVKIYEVQNH